MPTQLPDDVETEFVGMVGWDEAVDKPEWVVRLIDESERITVIEFMEEVYLRVEYNHLSLDLLQWLHFTQGR